LAGKKAAILGIFRIRCSRLLGWRFHCCWIHCGRSFLSIEEGV